MQAERMKIGAIRKNLNQMYRTKRPARASAIAERQRVEACHHSRLKVGLSPDNRATCIRTNLGRETRSGKGSRKKGGPERPDQSVPKKYP